MRRRGGEGGVAATIKSERTFSVAAYFGLFGPYGIDLKIGMVKLKGNSKIGNLFIWFKTDRKMLGKSLEVGQRTDWGNKCLLSEWKRQIDPNPRTKSGRNKKMGRARGGDVEKWVISHHPRSEGKLRKTDLSGGNLEKWMDGRWMKSD